MNTSEERRNDSSVSADVALSHTRKIIEKAGITLPKLINEFKSIAFSNIRDYVSIAEGGELQAIALDTIPTRKLKAVRKIKEKTNIAESKDGETIFKRSTIEYELYDKMDALQYLCKLAEHEPSAKTELSGAVTIMKPDTINKPDNAGRGSGE